jgi:hypothetical protein
MDEREYRAIDQIAAAESEMFLAEQASQFIDCALNLAMESMPTSSVIRLLREHIAILEEYE